jgi:hypothetical protein
MEKAASFVQITGAGGGNQPPHLFQIMFWQIQQLAGI